MPASLRPINRNHIDLHQTVIPACLSRQAGRQARTHLGSASLTRKP